MPQRHLIASLTLLLCLPALAQQTKTDAELDAEATQANDLYLKSQTLATLPLYEDLHLQRPTRLVYTERLAMAYIAKSGADPSPQDAAADRNTARRLFKEEEDQGGKSDLLQIMIEKLGTSERHASAAISPDDPRAPGGFFAQAEQAFSKGDLKASIELYDQSWQKFPSFYAAPLFAGDAEYKLGHYDQAGTWFARAIAIDPDTETAHRYWADCLMKAGKPEQARDQYLLAFIANPYEKAPRLSLRAWANAQHYLYVPPPITLPPPPVVGKDGNINITIDPNSLKDPLAMAWIGYPTITIAWRKTKFAQQFPNEKTYRHSLAEESEALHSLLTVVRGMKIAEDKYTPTIRSLMALEKDNMIECWVLLDAPDNGTAQDYVAYRAAHRDLLRAYIEKYDLHPA